VCGDWSNIAAVAVELPPSGVQTVTTPATAYNGSYTVSWTASDGAATYELQESANGGSWTLVQNTAARSLAISGKPTGSYGYRVRACNPVGCTGYSATATTAVVYPPTAAPSLSAPARVGPGSIGIGWNAIAGATRYTLQESANGAAWVTLLDGNATSYATPARGVGSYAYRVAACNGAGCGSWSGNAGVTVVSAPTLEPVINAPGWVNVRDYAFSWSTPANTEYFILQESANGAGWVTLLADGRTSAAVGRDNGSYAYRVQACNFVGCGPWSGIATVNVVLPPPATSFYIATWLTTRRPPYQVQCEAGWREVPGATEYQLESGGGGERLYTGPYGYVNARGGAYCAHSYRVRACNAGGCSAWTADYPVTTGVLSDE